MRIAICSIASVVSLLAVPGRAQESSGTWNGLPDRVQVDTGYFNMTADTVLTFQGGPGTGNVDFERDLGVDDNAHTKQTVTIPMVRFMVS